MVALVALECGSDSSGRGGFAERCAAGRAPWTNAMTNGKIVSFSLALAFAFCEALLSFFCIIGIIAPSSLF